MWCRVSVSNGPSDAVRNSFHRLSQDLILFNGSKDPSGVSRRLPHTCLTLERVTDHVPSDLCKAALQLKIFLPVLWATPASDLSSPAYLGWCMDTGPLQAEALEVEQELQTAAARSYPINSRGSRSLALVRDDLSGGVCIITTKAESCWLIFYYPGFG